ncbi:MAG: zinc-ribbon domain-containing protein [Lachnospiraceae bacterium]
MKYCEKCGAKLQDNERFCSEWSRMQGM